MQPGRNRVNAMSDVSAQVPRHAAAEELRPRQIDDAKRRRLEACASEILEALGMDLNKSATRETPRRFIQALIDATEGYEGDAKLVKVFKTECRGGSDCKLSQVIEGPIHFFAMCEHHGLPIYGDAYVGYIAHEHIIGLSKLNRLVRMFTRRFVVQERIGRQVADLLVELLQPHGVAVYLEAHHLCVEMRGVRDITPITRTTFWRGEYESNPHLQAAFFTACGLPR